MDPKTEDILNKYKGKIESQFNEYTPSQNFSREYLKFKEEMIPESSKYKSWAQTLGKLIKIRVGEKESARVQRQLDISHLDEITPSHVISLAAVSMLLVLFLTLMTAAAIYFITQEVQLL